ncbi:MAG: HypC/HybG/HupF family hydrogenase formation chaperone [Acidimicrobiia bacterium]|nr:HypC/HybG/HupF family hydrogenase formation chaperone [Acidimicrobiia bacterium]
MCLGIPGKVVEVYDLDGARMGKVDFDGIVKEICLSFVPEAEVGDYTIVHVGFGITKVDEESAHETLALMKEMGVLEAELDASVALAEEEAIAKGDDRA